MYNAIKVGYRLFDGAGDCESSSCPSPRSLPLLPNHSLTPRFLFFFVPLDGNEKECGEGVTRALKEGIVKREELCTSWPFRLVELARHRPTVNGLQTDRSLSFLGDVVYVCGYIVITSKLWNTFHAKEHVPQLIKKQLEDWCVPLPRPSCFLVPLT